MQDAGLQTATYATKEAMQIFGGYGFICDYDIGLMYRDAKITEIYEGTNEVQSCNIENAVVVKQIPPLPPFQKGGSKCVPS